MASSMLFFCLVLFLFLTCLVHFSHPTTISSSFPIDSPPLSVFGLYSSLPQLPLLLRSFILCLSFLVFFCCLFAYLHQSDCSDTLNLLRGSWRLSWWTTHRTKAQLDKKTPSKAKYVLFSSWKYVCTVNPDIFQSICHISARNSSFVATVVESW